MTLQDYYCLVTLHNVCPSWLGCVDLPLDWQKIAAATIATFAEPLIHVEIARLVACRAKVPWGDLHRLPILLMKYHRHIVVCSSNLYDCHRLSPLYWGTVHASHQFLAEAIPPLLEVLDRHPLDQSQGIHLRTAPASYPFSSPRVKDADRVPPVCG